MDLEAFDVSSEIDRDAFYTGIEAGIEGVSVVYDVKIGIRIGGRGVVKGMSGGFAAGVDDLDGVCGTLTLD